MSKTPRLQLQESINSKYNQEDIKRSNEIFKYWNSVDDPMVLLKTITEKLSSEANRVKDSVSYSKVVYEAITESVATGITTKVEGWDNDPTVFLTIGHSEMMVSESIFLRTLIDNLGSHIVKSVKIDFNNTTISKEYKDNNQSLLNEVLQGINEVLPAAVQWYSIHGGCVVVKKDIQDINERSLAHTVLPMVKNREDYLPTRLTQRYVALPLYNIVATGFSPNYLQWGSTWNITAVQYVPHDIADISTKKKIVPYWLKKPILVKDNATLPIENMRYIGFSAPLIVKKFHSINAVQHIHKIIQNSANLANIISYKSVSEMVVNDMLDIRKKNRTSEISDALSRSKNSIPFVTTALPDQLRVENLQFEHLLQLFVHYLAVVSVEFGLTPLLTLSGHKEQKDDLTEMSLADVIYHNVVLPLIKSILKIEFPDLNPSDDFYITRITNIENKRKQAIPVSMMSQALATIKSAGGGIFRKGDIHALFSELLDIQTVPEILKDNSLYPLTPEDEIDFKGGGDNTKTKFPNVDAEVGKSLSKGNMT